MKAEIKRIPIGELEEINVSRKVMDKFVAEVQYQHQQLIIQALTEYLGYEPTEIDKSNLHIDSMGNVIYGEKRIGHIVQGVEFNQATWSHKYRTTFIPTAREQMINN